jgi:hypothetical protein
MIRINKGTAQCPMILTTDGVTQTSNDCRLFNISPANYLSGKLTMPHALSSIYRHSTVMDALMVAQRHKCCYCERSRETVELDVEHFRPKAAVQQSIGAEILHPGYYWLAYSWDNLYLSCKRCNTGWKRFLFPLADPAKRARSHKSKYKISDEQPLFIDPGENPRSHVRFRNDAPFPITTKGRITIENLGLLGDERPLLKEARLDRLKDLRIYCEVVNCASQEPSNATLGQVAARARKRLQEFAHPSAEFSSMARDYIRNNLIKV